MDSLITLAIYVGKLEARIEALEKGIQPAPIIREEVNTEAQKEEEKLMEGFDNLMNYQWPPKKDGDE